MILKSLTILTILAVAFTAVIVTRHVRIVTIVEEWTTYLEGVKTEDDYDQAVCAVKKSELKAISPPYEAQIEKNLFGAGKEKYRVFMKTFAPVAKVMFKILKPLMTFDKVPTEEQIDWYAESLVEIFANLSENAYQDALLFEDPDFSRENVEYLINLISSNETHDKNYYVTELKKHNKPLYCLVSSIHFWMNGKEEKNEKDCSDRDLEYLVEYELPIKQAIVYFKSKENAISALADFVILRQAFKESRKEGGKWDLDNIKKILAKSERLNALMNVGFEIFMPEEKYSTAAEKILRNFYIENAFLIGKASMDDASAVAVLQTFTYFDTILLMLRIKGRNVKKTAEPDGIRKFLEMLKTEGNGTIYEEIIESNEPLISDEKLHEIKKKSPISYYFLYLVNDRVKALRRRRDLSETAEEYYGNITTVPYVLHWFAKDVCMSEDAIEHAANAKKAVAEKFATLTTAVKIEITEQFPLDTLEYCCY